MSTRMLNVSNHGADGVRQALTPTDIEIYFYSRDQRGH